MKFLKKYLRKRKCKIGFHEYETVFIPYADQPFEDDDDCCIEGYRILKCVHCGDEAVWTFKR